MNGQSFLKDPQTNWKYILIVAFLASIVGGWTLIYSQKIEKEVASIRFIEIKIPEKIDRTADWGTLRSEDLDFEIEYPEDWMVSFERGPVAFSPNAYYILSSEYAEITDWKATVRLIRCGSEISFKPEDLEKTLETYDISKYEEFIQGEIKVIKATEFTGVGAPDFILIGETEVCFFFDFDQNISEKEREEHKKILDQMLSTFRFLE